MKGIKIGIHHLFVTFSALVDDFLTKVGLVYPLYGVGLVAIAADGQLFLRSVHLPAVDAAFELLEDSQVAISSRSCNILGADRGVRVVSGEFTVSRMAIDASGGHEQSTFQQPLAVNTHAVILQNLLLLTLID